MILYQAPDSPASWNSADPTYNFVETVDTFNGPLVGISNAAGTNLQNYIDTTAIASYMANGAVDPWPLVTMDLSGAVRAPDPPGYVDSIASFSSIGPSTAYLGTCSACTPALLKPELVAIGGGDYNLYPDPNDSSLYGFTALYTAAESYDPSGEVYSSTRYASADGTSFSSPIAAGAAALVKQAHPSYTAAQIKSALVNWSNASAVTGDDFGDSFQLLGTGPLQSGAGLLDAGAASQATITANPSTISFGAVKTGGSLPAAQQIGISNLGTKSVTLSVAVAPTASASGSPVTVAPTSLTIAAGASGTLTVSLTGAVPAAGSYYGSVNLTGGGVNMHVPYLFQVASGLLASGSTITGNVIPIYGTSFDGIVGTDVGAIGIQVMDASGLPVTGANVSFQSSGGLTMKSVSGEPACTGAGSTIAVTCPTDNYGIAYTDVVLGQTVAQETIALTVANISALTSSSGNLPYLYVNVRAQPTIAPASGVKDAAQGKTTIAPGSYVSLYGAAFSDSTGVETTSTLPLALDGVTVSFDVPSANISVPGRLVYASPTQVNVQVPWELQGVNGPVQMKVTLYEYEYGGLYTATVADTAPTFFESIYGAEVAGLIANTYQFITPGTPALRGAQVQLYANGLGPVNNQPASGGVAPSTKIATTKATPTVTIGGQAALVSYCGLAPGYPGLYEVDLTVPSNAPVGAQTISLTIAGQTATSTITVN